MRDNWYLVYDMYTLLVVEITINWYYWYPIPGGWCVVYLGRVCAYLIFVTSTTSGACGEKICHVEKFFHVTDCHVEKFLRMTDFSTTCVSAFVEILQSLQCKIFQYTFLRKYLMKFWDFFSLFKIQHPAWLPLDHKKLKPSDVRLWDPCIMKLKNALWSVVYCFENHLSGYLLNFNRIKISLPWVWVPPS